MAKSAVLIFLTLFSLKALSQSLTDAELLYRCYGHLTSKRLKANHPLLLRVKSNELSGVEACEVILRQATLKNNGVLASSSREAVSVLSTMTKLHMTFFKKQAMVGANSSMSLVSNDIYDEQSSALHFTKALFDAKHGVDDILKVQKDLEGVRTNPLATVRGPSSNYLASKFTRKAPNNQKIAIIPNFVMTGDLIGLKDARPFNVPESSGSTINGIDIRNTLGGGLLGTRAYLKRSAPSNNPTTNYNGAVSMNRVWANTVLEDFLCKSLPAVRLADGQPYKSQQADAPFRKTDGCIQCHATMDQLAAGGRNLRVSDLTRGNAGADNPQLRYPFNRPVDQPMSTVWPIKSDSMYSRRPAGGRLYFRSYTGDLINRTFSNFDELADKLLETDDYYSCIAKKYYKHFTGVNASLADINDPFATIVLNNEDLFHRNEVIKLGRELQKTKDSMILIKSIMRSKVYSQKGYTILEAD